MEVITGRGGKRVALVKAQSFFCIFKMHFGCRDFCSHIFGKSLVIVGHGRLLIDQFD